MAFRYLFFLNYVNFAKEPRKTYLEYLCLFSFWIFKLKTRNLILFGGNFIPHASYRNKFNIRKVMPEIA